MDPKITRNNHYVPQWYQQAEYEAVGAKKRLARTADGTPRIQSTQCPGAASITSTGGGRTNPATSSIEPYNH